MAVTLYLEGIFYGAKRATLSALHEELKMKDVNLYEEGNKSYNTLSEELGLRSYPAKKLGKKIS